MFHFIFLCIHAYFNSLAVNRSAAPGMFGQPSERGTDLNAPLDGFRNSGGAAENAACGGAAAASVEEV